jgi:hypothetical protein
MIVGRYTPATLNFGGSFVVFLVSYADADEALKIMRKSAVVELLAEVETACDIIFRGFAEILRFGVHHFDAAIRGAVRCLQITLDPDIDTWMMKSDSV